MRSEWGSSKRFNAYSILILFTAMSIVIYLDRGIMGSTPILGTESLRGKTGIGIKGEFPNVTDTEIGFLTAAFMLGLLISCPLFVKFSEHVKPFKLVGIGLVVWMTAVVSAALSWNIWSLVAFRTAVGVGEASFVIFAAPFINQYAPPHLKAAWLAIFLMAIPVGFALGYIFGASFGSVFGWRVTFCTEALFMLPLAVISFLAPPLTLSDSQQPSAEDDRAQTAQAESFSPQQTQPGVASNAGLGLSTALLSPADETPLLMDTSEHPSDEMKRNSTAAAEETTEQLHSHCNDGSGSPPQEPLTWHDAPAAFDPMFSQVTWLLRQPDLVLAILVSTLYTAFFGVVSTWGPTAATKMFELPLGSADICFGASTVLTGIFGTFAGGWLLAMLGDSLQAAAVVGLVSLIGGLLLLMLALVITTFPWFITIFSSALFVLFMLQAPVTRIILLSTPATLQSLAMSMQTISIHLLGDVPSPPLAGWIHDRAFHDVHDMYVNTWRYTFMVVSVVLVPGAILMLVIYRKSVLR